MKMNTCYFLGANSANGFVSLYDDFTDSMKGDFLYVIKGSPGCGKSTFMKKLAAEANALGYSVETVLCSGDPESLDGVYIPELKLGYVDGTAPHVLEPEFPGVSGRYLDLGSYSDPGALRSVRPEIMRLTGAYREKYRRAYIHLAEADRLDSLNLPEAVSEDAMKKARALGEDDAAQLLSPGDGFRSRRRFISAHSSLGTVFLQDALCGYDRIFSVDDCLGLGRIYLQGFYSRCRLLEKTVLRCPDPLHCGYTFALLLPEDGTAVLVSSPELPLDDLARPIRSLSELAPTGATLRQVLDARQSLRRVHLSSAHKELRRAKELHDELEALYRPHIDFPRQNELCNEHIAALRDGRIL